MNTRIIFLALLVLLPCTLSIAQEANSDLVLAEAFYDRGDWENAVNAYDLVLISETEQSFILQRMSYSLLRCDRYRRARVVLERLIELDPDNLTAHYNLGILHWRTKRLFLAIPSFETVLKKDSTVADAWHCLGLIYAELEKTEKAWEIFDRLTGLDQDAAEHLHHAIRRTEDNLNDPVSDW